MYRKVLELKALLKFIGNLVDNPGIQWDDIYSQVFSENCSRRVHALFNELNLTFNYYDPDSSYEDDVRAFHSGLKSRLEELEPLFQTFPR